VDTGENVKGKKGQGQRAGRLACEAGRGASGRVTSDRTFLSLLSLSSHLRNNEQARGNNGSKFDSELVDCLPAGFRLGSSDFDRDDAGVIVGRGWRIVDGLAGSWYRAWCAIVFL
jgi:hypothetical protein